MCTINKNKGWYKESGRHALASKGVPTKAKAVLEHQYSVDELKAVAESTLSSPQIKDFKSEEWDNRYAIGFRLKPHKNSVERRHDSSVFIQPTKDGLKVEGEFRFPYSEDRDMVDELNDVADEFMSERDFETKPWVIHSTYTGSLSDPKDFWSSHLHFKKCISPKRLADTLESISEAIDVYYEEVDK